jgi:hypothetical protein
MGRRSETLATLMVTLAGCDDAKRYTCTGTLWRLGETRPSRI